MTERLPGAIYFVQEIIWHYVLNNGVQFLFHNKDLILKMVIYIQ